MAKVEENKAVKAGFFARLAAGTKNLGKNTGRFFMNMFRELKKVTWPTKKEMINYSVIVFTFMIVMAIVIYAFDFGASALIDLIVSL